jgi:hypothetical protein
LLRQPGSKVTFPIGHAVTEGVSILKTNRAVSNYGNRLARADPGSYGGMMVCPHHIRKREKRRHQLVVFADRQDEECSVGQRDPHRFGLRPRYLAVAEEPTVDARRMASTMPIASCPIRRPPSVAAIPRYGQRSLPQMHARVTRTMASEGGFPFCQR